jgi:hypothetical protein
VVTVAVGLLTLYTQWPHTTEEKVTLSAHVDPSLTFRRFVRENCKTGEPCGSYSKTLMKRRVIGITVYVTEITGFKNTSVQVEWQLIGPAYASGIASDFSHTLPTDARPLEPFWISLPSRSGTYHIKIVLTNAAKPGVTLGIACTPTFKVFRRDRKLRGAGGQGAAFKC